MKLLFICTGNTCRSPMAMCLARQLMPGCQADSAGLYPQIGQRASPGAVNAMASMGLSLKGHTAKAVTTQLLNWADLVLLMTPSHLAALERAYPGFGDKCQVFNPAIDDPFGGSDGVYLSTAGQLRQQLSLLAQGLSQNLP